MRLALFSFIVTALSVQQAVSISIGKRSSNIDISILLFALTLERLEVAFYTLGLQKFSEEDFVNAGYDPIVHSRILAILQHEQDHVAMLTGALGKKTPSACKYTFPPLNGDDADVQTFLHVSQVIEDVGSSAYAGAAPLLSSKKYISASASILVIEANQEAWLASSVNNNVPWGGSFKVPLSMKQAFTLASAFISSCPSSNPKLDLTAFPPLTIDGAFPTNQSAPLGQTVKVQSPKNATHIAFLTGLSQIFVPIINGTVLLPQNVSGQVYAVATNTSGPSVTDSTIAAGPVIMLFERYPNFTLTN